MNGLRKTMRLPTFHNSGKCTWVLTWSEFLHGTTLSSQVQRCPEPRSLGCRSVPLGSAGEDSTSLLVAQSDATWGIGRLSTLWEQH